MKSTILFLALLCPLGRAQSVPLSGEVTLPPISAIETQLYIQNSDGKNVMVCVSKNHKISNCKLAEGETFETALQVVLDAYRRDSELCEKEKTEIVREAVKALGGKK